jgi:hypothetical protein
MIREAGGKTLADKRKRGLCSVLFCSKKATVRKSGSVRRHCPSCDRKILKERHPYTYWYDVWRSNSKRRGIPFEITKDEFIKFCQDNKYLELKGRGIGKATIDRKRSWEGYTYDNIQILEYASNSRKVWIDRKLKYLYDTGEEVTEEQMKEFKKELLSFEMEVDLYKPPPIDITF